MMQMKTVEDMMEHYRAQDSAPRPMTLETLSKMQSHVYKHSV